MVCLDISFPTPQENILFDEALLALAEKGKQPETLRFWESENFFVVLGRICKYDEDIKDENVRKDNILVVRRSSGGGTVVQGKGCLNYSLILSKEQNPQIFDLKKSYQFILGKIISALEILGVQATFEPISDLAFTVSRKKFSGNAQKRGKKFILHHGTLLYDFDTQKIERYLNIPPAVPEYRQGRSHLEFVDNLPLAREPLKKALKKIFNVDREFYSLTVLQQQSLNHLLNSKDIIVDGSIEK